MPDEANRLYDSRLAQSGLVDLATFRDFASAHCHDADGTMDWLAGKLRVLRTRLESGAALEVFEPARKQTLRVTTRREFADWLARHFPNVDLGPD